MNEKINLDELLKAIARTLGVERDDISFIQQDTSPYLYFEINLNDYECNFFKKTKGFTRANGMTDARKKMIIRGWLA